VQQAVVGRKRAERIPKNWPLYIESALFQDIMFDHLQCVNSFVKFEFRLQKSTIEKQRATVYSIPVSSEQRHAAI